MATYTVAASADDAYENDDDTGFSSTDTQLQVTANSTPTHSGFRFDGVAIPNAATILTAILQVHIPTGAEDSPECQIHMEDVDDAADFSTNADLANRSLTLTNVAWSDSGLTANTFHDSPDFTSVVQDIVDRAGWASGQAMMIVLKGNVDIGGPISLDITAYDTGPGTNPARFVVTWSGEFDASLYPETIVVGLSQRRRTTQPRRAPIAHHILHEAAAAFDEALQTEIITNRPTIARSRQGRGIAPYPSSEPTWQLDGELTGEIDIFPPAHRRYVAPKRTRHRHSFLDGTLPLPDAPQSCAGTAIMVRSGVGSGVISGLANKAQSYTGTITRTGVGTARMYRTACQ